MNRRNKLQTAALAALLCTPLAMKLSGRAERKPVKEPVSFVLSGRIYETEVVHPTANPEVGRYYCNVQNKEGRYGIVAMEQDYDRLLGMMHVVTPNTYYEKVMGERMITVRVHPTQVSEWNQELRFGIEDIISINGKSYQENAQEPYRK